MYNLRMNMRSPCNTISNLASHLVVNSMDAITGLSLMNIMYIFLKPCHVQCNHSVALESFFHQVVWKEPVKLALIGGGCSVATEPTADVSHFYNITQVLSKCGITL